MIGINRFFVSKKMFVQKLNTETMLEYHPMKPWCDFSQQADILIKRNLVVDDVSRLEKYLTCIGYYRLSGYLYPFRQWDEVNQVLLNDFMPDSYFRDVLSLYLFDKKLRLLALDALERIEIAIKVDISYLLGSQHALAHRHSVYFDGKFIKSGDHQKWMDYVDGLIDKAKRRQISYVLHHYDKYGDLPIWVICNLWDFGAMSKLYQGMKRKDRDKIAQKYGLSSGNEFAKWLKSLNEIRNICAHHDRLWNHRIVVKSSKIEQPFWDKLNNNRPFFYFCIMQQIMKVLCPHSQWSQRFHDLLKEFPEHKSAKINLKVFGLMDDYQQWDLWK